MPFRSSTTIFFLSLLNLILGLCVQIGLAAALGTGREMDAFFVAVSLPTFLTAVSVAACMSGAKAGWPLRSKHGSEAMAEINELTELMKGARFFVWPSEGYYETFGYVAIESFSCGVPVLTRQTGVQEETVQEGVTGLHFRPGDGEDLAAKAAWIWGRPDEMEVMGRAARSEYEKKYTGQANYPMVMNIYKRALDSYSGKTA